MSSKGHSGMSQIPMTRQNTMAPLSQKQRNFLADSLDEICAAVENVSGDAIPGLSLNPRWRKRSASFFVTDYIMKDVPREPSSWREHVQFLNALRSGINQGAVVIDTVEDADTFSLLFLHDMFTIPQVVEYYCATGELMELLELLKVNDLDPQGHQTVFVLPEDTNTKMLRFYAYDVNRANRARKSQDDAESHMGLPLEIRLTFSRVLETAAADMETFFVRTKASGISHTRLMDYAPYRRLRFDL